MKMRTILVLTLLFIISSQWVIYRKVPKRKIVCKPEYEWDNNTEASTPSSTSSSKESSSEESVHQTKRDTVESEHVLVLVRKRRDVEIDPRSKEPIIFLGQKTNVSSSFVDDGDFDIVSDYLTADELKLVKQQIMNTCNYLDRDRLRQGDSRPRITAKNPNP